MIHGTDAVMDSFCSGDLPVVWFVYSVVPAPLLGFAWFSCLLDLAQLSFEDLLTIEASSFLPLLHVATFPVSSRAGS